MLQYLFFNHVKDPVRFFQILSAKFWSWFCKIILFNTIIRDQSLLVLSSAGNRYRRGCHFNSIVSDRRDDIAWANSCRIMLSRRRSPPASSSCPAAVLRQCSAGPQGSGAARPHLAAATAPSACCHCRSRTDGGVALLCLDRGKWDCEKSH